MAEGPRIVFMGTPAFAASILADMLGADWNIVGVYTQPDSKSGRGLKVHVSPVKELAQKKGAPVFQPHNFRADADVENLRRLEPDFLVVASYGLILPQKVLDVPKIAPLNIHASLLPKYRGAAPIQRAIQDSWQGDGNTGISLMRMEKELDAGPVYATTEVPLAGATAPELTEILAKAGGKLLLKSLPLIASGKLQPIAQNDAEATYAPRLTKTDGEIDWRKSAREVAALVRAMNPWPGARTRFELGETVVPVLIRAGLPVERGGEPGQLINSRDGLVIACGDGSFRIDLIQPEGRKEMSGKDFANGRHLAAGVVGLAR